MEQTMKAAEEELLNTELARRFRGGISCTNEYGVAVVGTVSTEVTEAYEKVDPAIKGTLREATLAGIIAGQVKTAREAAKLCCKLHDKYPYSSAAFLAASWIFTMISFN